MQYLNTYRIIPKRLYDDEGMACEIDKKGDLIPIGRGKKYVKKRKIKRVQNKNMQLRTKQFLKRGKELNKKLKNYSRDEYLNNQDKTVKQMLKDILDIQSEGLLIKLYDRRHETKKKVDEYKNKIEKLDEFSDPKKRSEYENKLYKYQRMLEGVENRIYKENYRLERDNVENKMAKDIEVENAEEIVKNLDDYDITTIKSQQVERANITQNVTSKIIQSMQSAIEEQAQEFDEKIKIKQNELQKKQQDISELSKMVENEIDKQNLEKIKNEKMKEILDQQKNKLKLKEIISNTTIKMKDKLADLSIKSKIFVEKNTGEWYNNISNTIHEAIENPEKYGLEKGSQVYNEIKNLTKFISRSNSKKYPKSIIETRSVKNQEELEEINKKLFLLMNDRDIESGVKKLENYIKYVQDKSKILEEKQQEYNQINLIDEQEIEEKKADENDDEEAGFGQKKDKIFINWHKELLPDGISINQLEKLIRNHFYIYGEDLDYNLQFITENNQEIKQTDKEYNIIIFLKNQHFTCCIHDKPPNRSEIVFFDPLANENNLDENFNQIKTYAVIDDEKLMTKFKFNKNAWQQSDLTRKEYDKNLCGIYVFIFIINYCSGQSFKQASNYDIMDQEKLENMIQEFGYI